jgi:purine-nucleoside phosphorylase
MNASDLAAAASVVRTRAGVASVDVAVVLGSGWSLATEGIGVELLRLSYRDVPGMHTPSVSGHDGTLRVLDVNGLIILALGGRTHLYEDRGTDAVVAGVRLGSELGANLMLLTNGCGSVRPEWGPGTPVLIGDHLNLTATSPLSGPTFIDCTEVYDRRLRDVVRGIDSSVVEGVYAQFRGPQYETPAEVRMAGILGADLVGMSTTLEALEARRLGMRVLGFSLVTNLAAGVSPHPLDHQEVIEAGRAAAPRLKVLLGAFFEHLAGEKHI